MKPTREELVKEVDQLIETYSQTKALDEGYYNGLIKKLKKEKLWEELGHVYCCMASIYANIHKDIEMGEAYLSKCYKLVKKYSIPELELRYFLIQGNIFKVAFKHAKAINSFNHGVEIFYSKEFNSYRSLKQIFLIFYSLALTHSQCGALDKFKYNVDKAKKIAERIGDEVLLAKCYYQLCEYHLIMGNKSNAEEYIMKSIQVLKSKEEVYALGIAFTKLGDLLDDKGIYEESLNKFIEGYELMKKVYPNANYCHELLRIGEGYFKLEQREKGLEFYLLAYEQSKTIFNKRTKMAVIRALQGYYRDINETDKVVCLLDELIELKEEVYNDNQVSSIAEVEEKYQSALKQKEINFRKKKQREAERYIEVMEEQNKLTKNMIELLNKGLKNPVKNGKQMLDVLNRGGLNPENKTKIIKNIHEYFGQIEQFSKDVKEIIQSDSKEALGEKLDASRIISLVNKNLAGKTDEYDLDRAKYPKTYFIQEHVSRLAKNSEQNRIDSFTQNRSVGVMI